MGFSLMGSVVVFSDRRGTAAWCAVAAHIAFATSVVVVFDHQQLQKAAHTGQAALSCEDCNQLPNVDRGRSCPRGITWEVCPVWAEAE